MTVHPRRRVDYKEPELVGTGTYSAAAAAGLNVGGDDVVDEGTMATLRLEVKLKPAKKHKRKGKRALEDNARAQLVLQAFAQFGLPPCAREYRFHVERQWRFDYAWPEVKVALEVEGGAWVGGRHTSGAGFESDMEKYNAAGLAGWRVFRCLPKNLIKTATLEMMRQATSSPT